MTRSIILFVWAMLSCSSLSAQGFFEYLTENSHRSFSEIREHLDEYYATHDRGKGSGFKQYMRWADNAERHLTSDGHIANAAARSATELVKYRRNHPLSAVSQNRSTHGAWFPEGPDAFTGYYTSSSGLGRVNRMGFHPTDPNTYYACTPAGGLWRTTDNAATWTPMTDQLPLIGCSGFAIDYNHTDTMYLLTGDGDGGDTYSIGVLKSINGGVDWIRTSSDWEVDSFIRPYKLLMHPINPSILFMATSKGLFRTTDGAASWDTIMTGWITDIEFMPGNPAMMYAVSTSTFFRSSDTGATFTPDMDSDFPSDWSRIEIGVTPADSSYVYLLFGGHVDGTGNGTYSGVCHSNDFGADFALQSSSPNILGYSILGDDSLHQAFYDLSLAVDPIDPDIIYVGAVNNWRSFDAGVTWQFLTHWADIIIWPYCHGDQHELVFNGTTLFAANDGGVYTYEPSSGAWSDRSAGLAIMQPYNIDVHNDNVLLGTQDNGSLRWDLINSNTAVAEFGGDGFDCMWDPSSPEVFYVSTQNSLQLTTTNGSSFGPINVPGYGAGEYWYVDLMMHPQNFDTIYVGFGKKNDTIPDVFRSYNRGGDWTKLNCGLNASVRALVQSPVNPDLAIVASSKKMVRTANLHASSPDWKALADLPMLSGERYIQDVAFDPDNPARIFACVSGYSESNKIFMSVDTGNHWTNITGSLPNVPFHSLLVEDNAVNGIYAGSDIGVFYRNDNMSDWIHFSNHLPVTPVYDLDIDNSTLYAGTFGRGIWSSTLYTSCPTSQFFTQNDQPDGKQVYHTSGWITTSQVIEGNLGVDIQYHSEGFIKFISGFQAKAGNLVMAKIEGCPD